MRGTVRPLPLRIEKELGLNPFTLLSPNTANHCCWRHLSRTKHRYKKPLFVTLCSLSCLSIFNIKSIASKKKRLNAVQVCTTYRYPILLFAVGWLLVRQRLPQEWRMVWCVNCRKLNVHFPPLRAPPFVPGQANVCFNAALEMTTVASTTTLSSTSSAFTLFMGWMFGTELATKRKIIAVSKVIHLTLSKVIHPNS